MQKIIFATVLLLFGTSAFAHEGHNEAPGTIKALHGGTVKKGKEINLEVVSSGGELKLFPRSHAGEDISTSEVTITATAQPPKGKPAPLVLEAQKDAFTSKLDFKGSYRLSLEIKSDYKGKKDIFKIQVEQ